MSQQPKEGVSVKQEARPVLGFPLLKILPPKRENKITNLLIQSVVFD
jgi:hypothetical protein